MGQRFKELSMERPRAAVVVPKGTLAFVPNLLPQPSYELLIAIGFKALSYETAFPLLLTAARWRGEGHVINVRRRRLARHASVTNIHLGSKYRPLADGLAIARGQKRYSPIVLREINSGPKSRQTRL